MLAASFLGGWAVKALVTKYGGAAWYQRLKPFVFGLIAGEMLGGVTPMVVGMMYWRSPANRRKSSTSFRGRRVKAARAGMKDRSAALAAGFPARRRASLGGGAAGVECDEKPRRRRFGKTARGRLTCAGMRHNMLSRSGCGNGPRRTLISANRGTRPRAAARAPGARGLPLRGRWPRFREDAA